MGKITPADGIHRYSSSINPFRVSKISLKKQISKAPLLHCTLLLIPTPTWGRFSAVLIPSAHFWTSQTASQCFTHSRSKILRFYDSFVSGMQLSQRKSLINGLRQCFLCYTFARGSRIRPPAHTFVIIIRRRSWYALHKHTFRKENGKFTITRIHNSSIYLYYMPNNTTQTIWSPLACGNDKGPTRAF